MDLENNIPLGAGKGIVRYRCGANHHTLKSRPLPFQQKLAFAPPNTSVKGKWAKKQSSIMIADGQPENGSHAENEHPIQEEHEMNITFDTSGAHFASQEQYGDYPSYNIDSSAKEDAARLSERANPDHETFTTLDFLRGGDIPLSVYQSSGVSSDTDNPQNRMGPLIDSGAARTVVGISWLGRWLRLGDTASDPTLQASNRIFKFGNEKKFVSDGVYIIHGEVRNSLRNGAEIEHIFNISADVVTLPIPLLISNHALLKLRAPINFGILKMLDFGGAEIDLYTSKSGHLAFKWEHSSSSPNLPPTPTKHPVYATNEAHPPTNGPIVSSDIIRMIHIQLGRCVRFCYHAKDIIGSKEELQHGRG